MHVHRSVDACMMICDEIKPLYLEMDASGEGLGAGLQVRGGMNCLPDTALDKIILGQIAFAGKSLSNAERIYKKTERDIRSTTWVREVLSILLCKRGMYHYC